MPTQVTSVLLKIEERYLHQNISIYNELGYFADLRNDGSNDVHGIPI